MLSVNKIIKKKLIIKRDYYLIVTNYVGIMKMISAIKFVLVSRAAVQ